MQKITPHLWFDNQVKEATALYTSLFKDSKIKNISTITGTPSGDCDIVNFALAGQEFMGIDAGPYFQFNPAISLFVVFDNEQEIKATWEKLIDGGKALMEYDTYPWAHKYGWLQDKFGLSWQLSWSEHHDLKQKITPFLMFTQNMSGKAKEAMQFYTDVFKNSKIEMQVPYEKGDSDQEGFIKHGRFTLEGQQFMALDSSAAHDFVFNEAVSLIVNCKDQAEIDYFWQKLSAVPEAEQCGWLKDKFGVSWQIVPVSMNEMMASGSKEQIDRLTQAFLSMKKFDLAKLKKAWEG